jgi:hypothetical protein
VYKLKKKLILLICLQSLGTAGTSNNEMLADTCLASLQFQKSKGRSCTPEKPYAKIFSHEVLHEHAAEDEDDDAIQEEAADEVDFF